MLIIIAESSRRRLKLLRHPANAGQIMSRAIRSLKRRVANCAPSSQTSSRPATRKYVASQEISTSVSMRASKPGWSTAWFCLTRVPARRGVRSVRSLLRCRNRATGRRQSADRSAARRRRRNPSIRPPLVRRSPASFEVDMESSKSAVVYGEPVQRRNAAPRIV
jgi:hypothetical protein